ncbi:ABC transporter ATP-binding protein [Streptomyces sp. NPDC056821]|uniref:ABC transporter ATP-binding protein n=1 Tax=unclassified Streptomyces TaxID=2593676 RepID=UPI0036BEBB3E
MNMPSPSKTLLEIRNLSVEYQSGHPVLDDVSLDVRHNEIVGLVGESGSGKSTTLRSVVQLQMPARITAGRVFLSGQELTTLPRRQLRAIRGKDIGFIAQNPFDALNPVLRVRKQFENVVRAHRDLDKAEIRERASELLKSCGIADTDRVLDGYAHQLSGGMAQRTVIALALSLDPRLLIADEPTTALDLTVQRQVLDLTRSLVRQAQRSMLLVTHDLGVVANYCDRVVVMYGGRIVEQGTVAVVFNAPRHPYTRALLGAASGDTDGEWKRTAPPKMNRPQVGCNFTHRCPRVQDICNEHRPETVRQAGDSLFSCHHPIVHKEVTSVVTPRG